jgi:hypothetical protein
MPFATSSSPAKRTATIPMATIAKKKEPQKQFSLNNNLALFPSLGETLQNRKPLSMSFSSAAAKKIEQPKIKVEEVAPGWVHIRKQNGQIQYKYGASLERSYVNREREQAEIRLGNLLFKYRMAAEQYDRDMDVLRLGDLSDYYGEPTLAELFQEDMQAIIKTINDANELNYISQSDSDGGEY